MIIIFASAEPFSLKLTNQILLSYYDLEKILFPLKNI